MMYRRSRKYQEYLTKYAKAAREGKRINGIHPEYPSELPALRRLIKITDYDTGTPVTHRIELYRSNCVDCYSAWVHCITLFSDLKAVVYNFAQSKPVTFWAAGKATMIIRNKLIDENSINESVQLTILRVSCKTWNSNNMTRKIDSIGLMVDKPDVVNTFF
ncbi:hypothetical protein Q4508_18995 [Amphritea sp. 2_MG-2023]|nr:MULTISPECIES: hypothetical protein [Amphritea]MDO6420645.1 hypothetical protein [Amphritea sp. 2_MG-2023]